MTAANFPPCLAVILQSEGGFAILPNDPGGATNHGVTIGTWSNYIGHTATVAEMQALTVADVTPLYKSDFWNVCHCDDLPSGVDLMVFDEGVNAGCGRAIRALQASVGVTQDGIIGPATLAAVAACSAVNLIGSLATNRDAFYRSLPTFKDFGNGWLARVERTEKIALGMVGA